MGTEITFPTEIILFHVFFPIYKSTPWATNKGLSMFIAFRVRGSPCWMQLGGLSAPGWLFAVLLEGRPCVPTLRGWERYGLIFFPVVFGCGLFLCSSTHSCVPRAEQEDCSHCVLKRSKCHLA